MRKDTQNERNERNEQSTKRTKRTKRTNERNERNNRKEEEKGRKREEKKEEKERREIEVPGPWPSQASGLTHARAGALSKIGFTCLKYLIFVFSTFFKK